MHNNYFFLRHLSRILEHKLIGYELIKSYSQNKDELVLAFLLGEDEFYINAALRSDFSCLYFPENRARSKRNYAFLFKDLDGKKVIAVKQNRYDRSFLIVFEQDYELLFKMHGNRANVLLFRGNKLVEIFKSVLKNDLTLDPSELEKSIDLSLENFESKNGDIAKISPVFGKEIQNRADKDRYSKLSIEQKWIYFNNLLKELEEQSFYLTKSPHKNPSLSLFQTENSIFYENPIHCINDFFIEFSKNHQYNILFDRLQKELNGRVKKAKSYIQAAEKSLKKIGNESNYKHWADLVMANLHLIEKGASSTILDDFYSDQKIKVPLKKHLSPQKNAENYYRKSKNQRIEIENLEKNISEKKAERSNVENELTELLKYPDLKSLRDLENKHLVKSNDKSSHLNANKPFKEFIKSGFKVWLGRNAKKNDELTLKYASKNDLWLHAKDVSGSHVVIKEQAGKTIPKNVIEYAASLAAAYSKRKTESLCPVIVTQKKFVRKPKGFPPGAVKVEKEEVIMVPPLT
ncbi:MAG: NFACT RNA binding domain-containing protein [Bacteroidota bacterium]